jgi:hypothetical protein
VIDRDVDAATAETVDSGEGDWGDGEGEHASG